MCFALWGDAAPDVLFDLVGQHLKHKDNRTCRRWARHEREPPSSVLWLLIRSREGDRVVSFINECTGKPPSWWLSRQRALTVAVLAERFCKGVTALD